MHPRLLELYEVTDKVLGVGTFATVKEIKLKSTGQSFALKIILKKTLKGKIAMLDTEVAVLSKVRHPNCVSLLEMFETEDAVYLVTDLAAGGELFDQLLKKGNYTEVDAARLVREILRGVEYLHSMDIVHRDLKPENLLFLDKSENARLMITDFGLSKVLTNGDDVLMTACGTPGYVAPEVLEEIGHGKPVDMWSIGIIAYTLLCGYPPFWGEDQQTLFDHIIAGRYQYEDEYWKDISPLAKSFIDSLLVRPAEKRATATQALAHPWFSTMLDRDPAVTPSPPESVNLLPGVSKNINAGNVFKKAVRAVGILRRIQMLNGGGGIRVGAAMPNGEPGVQISTVSRAIETPDRARPNPVNLSLHDVVSAAMIAKQGGIGLHTPLNGEQDKKHVNDNSEEYLTQMDAVLESLTN
ncbi:MAG: calcium/calmodulin-dependent protein kinase type 1 [Benniella sp.]|nr:MAG: calcium/calmodulin-dependent protein kinase type 1 [Benniella sp.]